MTREEAISYYDNSPEWLRILCNAFADGVNYYLYTHPDIKPRLITRFEPWMAMYFSEGSIGGDLSKIPVGKIRDFYETITTYEHKNNNLQYSQTLKWAEPAGSNGIAISGDLTESGNPLLLINPHTTFYFRGEAHVVSEEGLNAYGAVTWGQFFIYQGFNDRIGLMHTSGYVDVIDEFLVTIEENDGKLIYEYGDELKPVEILEVTLKYKCDGKIREKVFPVYRTHHGPVTHMSGDK
jgi:acyl-homoserine lactone acylase PvdQ